MAFALTSAIFARIFYQGYENLIIRLADRCYKSILSLREIATHTVQQTRTHYDRSCNEYMSPKSKTKATIPRSLTHVHNYTFQPGNNATIANEIEGIHMWSQFTFPCKCCIRPLHLTHDGGGCRTVTLNDLGRCHVDWIAARAVSTSDERQPRVNEVSAGPVPA